VGLTGTGGAISAAMWRHAHTLLGAVIATALAAFASPVVADSKSGNGMKCDWDSDCQSDNCDDHRCKGRNNEKFGNGAKCDWDSDCQSDNCDDHRCKGRNNEKLDNGAKCDWDSDCKSDNCDDHRCKGR
jgi:hypothetical protein